MIFLTDLIPVVSSGEVPGHGQGLRYNDHEFYYAVETDIPKNRVVSLVREGNIVQGKRLWKEGARDWIIVAYDNSTDSFVLLEYVTRDLMRKLSKYKGRSPAEVIQEAYNKI